MTGDSKKLYLRPKQKKIGGVCAGLAEHFDVDITLVRVGFIASLFLGLLGGIVYLLLWALLDVEPDGTDLEYL